MNPDYVNASHRMRLEDAGIVKPKGRPAATKRGTTLGVFGWIRAKSRMEVRCSWCGSTMRKGDPENVTHSICEGCTNALKLPPE